MCYYGYYGSMEGETPADEVIQSHKCPCTESLATTSKRESIAKTINTVEAMAIVTKMKEKHGENGYPVEQFHCWAHMINSGKCSSYNEPPNFPSFNRAKAKKKPNEKEGIATDKVSPTTTTPDSPSTKRLIRRAQCIDQLSKWHLLLEAGGITQAQYDELKESIIDDMK